jgi:hypothetical protein
MTSFGWWTVQFRHAAKLEFKTNSNILKILKWILVYLHNLWNLCSVTECVWKPEFLGKQTEFLLVKSLAVEKLAYESLATTRNYYLNLRTGLDKVELIPREISIHFNPCSADWNEFAWGHAQFELCEELRVVLLHPCVLLCLNLCRPVNQTVKYLNWTYVLMSKQTRNPDTHPLDQFELTTNEHTFELSRRKATYKVQYFH